jgi:hypothetical protein
MNWRAIAALPCCCDAGESEASSRRLDRAASDVGKAAAHVAAPDPKGKAATGVCARAGSAIGNRPKQPAIARRRAAETRPAAFRNNPERVIADSKQYVGELITNVNDRGRTIPP